jgi:hypothetical protein
MFAPFIKCAEWKRFVNATPLVVYAVEGRNHPSTKQEILFSYDASKRWVNKL